MLSVIALQEGLVTILMLPQAWLGGLLLDALAGLYFCVPFAIYLWWMPERSHRSRLGSAILRIGFFLAIAALLYLIAAEYFFFDEFNARFNYTAVEYLIYPTEVFGNIRDSYPVFPVMAASVVGALLMLFVPRRRLQFSDELPQSLAQRSAIMAMLAVVTAASLWLVNLETVQGFSSNRIADEIAANGVYSFFSAVRNAKLDYARYYPTLAEDEAVTRVRKMLAQSNTKYLGPPGTTQSPLARQVDNSDLGPPRKLNVIILFEESMGSEFVGSLGGRDLTPNIDRIAAESLSFTNLYASGTRTVRGMEALTTSLAPVPPESVVKRTDNEGLFNLATIARAHGYVPSFVYGGYGTFDNMNAFFGSNGWSLFDRTDMPKPRSANIWGIADEELFDNALNAFDEQIVRGEPIFSLVMSTSNHKPYTFPVGIPGVKARGGGREAGVRYADYAIGKFFDKLRTKPWYSNTLLVIAGDHGPRVYGRSQIPLSNYPVPFIVHSPGNVTTGRNRTLSSQVDIGPTLLGLLHLNYTSCLPGRDILRIVPGDGYALFNHNRNVAMMRDQQVAVLGFGKQVTTSVYDAESKDLVTTATNRELERDTQALFQLSWEFFRDGRQREDRCRA